MVGSCLASRFERECVISLLAYTPGFDALDFLVSLVYWHPMPYSTNFSTKQLMSPWGRWHRIWFAPRLGPIVSHLSGFAAYGGNIWLGYHSSGFAARVYPGFSRGKPSPHQQEHNGDINCEHCFETMTWRWCRLHIKELPRFVNGMGERGGEEGSSPHPHMLHAPGQRHARMDRGMHIYILPAIAIW